MDSFFSDLFLIVFALAGLIFTIIVIRFVWRLLAGLMYAGGVVAEEVYETGDSATHSLLKVIITILFPPLLLLWLWKAVADSHREDAPARAERKEQQLREHQEKMASEKVARDKRGAEWIE